jgi:hypothetical protein
LGHFVTSSRYLDPYKQSRPPDPSGAPTTSATAEPLPRISFTCRRTGDDGKTYAITLLKSAEAKFYFHRIGVLIGCEGECRSLVERRRDL